MGKLKGMTMRQKIGYIRDYYTIHIVAAIAAIAAMGWILNHYVFNPPPNTFINISFYGQFIPDEQRIAFADGLTANLVEEGENYAVFIDNFFIANDPQFDMAMTQRFMAMVSARAMDILIISPGGEDEFFEGGFAQSLLEVFSADEMEIFYGMDSVIIGENDVPVGLRPAQFSYFIDLGRQLGINFDGWALIVLINSERDEAVRTFFDYTLFYYQ